MDPDPRGLLSKSDSAYEHLKRLVVEGRLRPRRRLAPSDLATEFGISVTPIRDALVRLHTEGYVGGESGRGYFTKPFSEAEQRELLQVLLVAVLAVLEAEEGEKAGLIQALSDFRAGLHAPHEAQGGSAASAHEALLLKLAAQGGNETLTRLLRNVLDRTQYIRRLDAEDVVRQRRVAMLLEGIITAALEEGLAGALPAARAYRQDQFAVLPDLVGRANAAIAANRFP